MTWFVEMLLLIPSTAVAYTHIHADGDKSYIHIWVLTAGKKTLEF